MKLKILGCVLLAAVTGCSDAVFDDGGGVDVAEASTFAGGVDGKADGLSVAKSEGVAPERVASSADAVGAVAKRGQRQAAPVCGGIQGVQCAKDQYCNYALGDGCYVSDAQGRCNTRPQVCTEEAKPVCGCDGTTYSNSCYAAMAGATVLHEGTCADACALTDDCAKNEVCFEGFCRLQPGACEGPFDCGDEQFCNDDGFCEDADVTCGGFLGVQCPDGQFCDYAQGDGCYVSDAQGVCVEVRNPCPRPTPDAQVCGCDGVTYASECEAHQAGMSVDSVGACQKPCATNSDCQFGEVCDSGACEVGPTVCGGLHGTECGRGQFCDFDQSTACGDSDFQGTCEARPSVCPDNFQPVCGCDGVTYESECSAQQSGVDYRHSGACDDRK